MSASAEISTSASIGQLLRAQFALNNMTTNEEKPKTVGFNESENMRLYELYSNKREEYHSTRPSGQRNEEVPMDTLAREWAAEITSMGFAERTPAQIKQRIRDMRKFSRKHAHKLGITGLSNSSSSPTPSTISSASGLDLDKLSAEFNWAETKRRSRGPVPDWMSGLAQIMMTEQEKHQEEADVTSDVMDATFGPKAKRLKLAKQSQPNQHTHAELMNQQKASIEQQLIIQKLKQQQQIKLEEEEARRRDREIREMSPETALIEKKLQLADAKLESERLRQQALRLEISYYQRQTQLYDEQILQTANELATSTSPVVDFLNFKLNGSTKIEMD
ncbi:unnamed protein product [Caenorhabditis angaria]|uniref:Uncharacterized protein n=1 Tax=Caenorhabditis angaria TaxID=860376 RepID=A0A9P1N4R5_9PELO|nr:unnamed protein product [Caenorhabditis angaria]